MCACELITIRHKIVYVPIIIIYMCVGGWVGVGGCVCVCIVKLYSESKYLLN